MWNTNDLCDDFGADVRVLPPLYHNFGGKQRFYGPVETIECYEDNSRVKEQLATPGHGRVLVVDGGGSLNCALLGDLIAASAVENGWQGVVIHGCCRDVHELRNMDLGVRALASVPRKSVRKGVGSVGQTVDLGGEIIESGNWLYADETGIVIANKALF